MKECAGRKIKASTHTSDSFALINYQDCLPDDHKGVRRYQSDGRTDNFRLPVTREQGTQIGGGPHNTARQIGAYLGAVAGTFARNSFAVATSGRSGSAPFQICRNSW